MSETPDTKKRGKPEPELELSPWEALWPKGATVRYSSKGQADVVELLHRCVDGVMLSRSVARGGTIEVSPELADELTTNNPDDWTKET